MRMQKDHDLTDDFLLRPGGDDALGAARADAVDLAQAPRRTLDDIEDLVAERLNEPFGIDRADASDHARGEVFLHALDRGRLRGFQELRPELQPVRAVILPGPARRHPFAGRDRRRMAKDGDQVLLPAHFHAQHAKAVLLVVKGHPFHKTGENLLFVRGRHQPLSSHANEMRLRVFFAVHDAELCIGPSSGKARSPDKTAQRDQEFPQTSAAGHLDETGIPASIF